jgi:hypothetical protein
MTVKETKAGAGVPRIGLLLLSYNAGLRKSRTMRHAGGQPLAPSEVFETKMMGLLG